MVKANKNDMTASTLVSSIIIVIKITNWKRKYTLPNQLGSLVVQNGKEESPSIAFATFSQERGTNSEGIRKRGMGVTFELGISVNLLQRFYACFLLS